MINETDDEDSDEFIDEYSELIEAIDHNDKQKKSNTGFEKNSEIRQDDELSPELDSLFQTLTQQEIGDKEQLEFISHRGEYSNHLKDRTPSGTNRWWKKDKK